MENPFKLHHCLRCGHDWWSKLDRPPKVCARCRSPYWSRPRLQRAPKESRPKSGPGRPATYPFYGIEVGETVFVAFHELPNGHPDEAKNKATIRAVRNASKNGKKFFVEPKSRGVNVTRIA